MDERSQREEFASAKEHLRENIAFKKRSGRPFQEKLRHKTRLKETCFRGGCEGVQFRRRSDKRKGAVQHYIFYL